LAASQQVDNPGEFQLIDSIVAQLGAQGKSAAVLLGPGDDAAMVRLPAGEALVTSVDTLVTDLHFPGSADPYLIGQRALRVSVSDLAAMGAQPLAAVVALTLPSAVQEPWVRDLSRGFGEAAETLACPVTGGNLTAGELSISVTVQGCVPPRLALLRSGATAGDDVWVSGPLGGAAVALARGGLASLLADALDDAGRQYFLPEPQIALGIALRGIATAAIDISDGLAADVAHIARASRVAIELTSAALPCLANASLEQALHGGDDYQLCFTAPEAAAQEIRQLASDAVCIGRCLPEATEIGGLLTLDGNPLAARGFDHFTESKRNSEQDSKRNSDDV